MFSYGWIRLSHSYLFLKYIHDLKRSFSLQTSSSSIIKREKNMQSWLHIWSTYSWMVFVDCVCTVHTRTRWFYSKYPHIILYPHLTVGLLHRRRLRGQRVRRLFFLGVAALWITKGKKRSVTFSDKNSIRKQSSVIQTHFQFHFFAAFIFEHS